MAAVRNEADLDRIMDEVRDRYGPPPDSVLNLAEYAAIRLMADRLRVESLDREGHVVVLKFRPDAKLDPAWLFRVIQSRGRCRPAAAGHAQARPQSGRKTARRRPTGPRRAGTSGKPRKGGDPVAGGSWWAARARAGEVAPGLLPRRDYAAGQGGPAGRGRRLRPGQRPPARVERRRVDRLKCCVADI